MKFFFAFTFSIAFLYLSNVVAQMKEEWEVVPNDSSCLSAEGMFVKIDHGGSVIVAGTVTLDSTDQDILVAKYDSSGNLIWKQTFNGVNDTTDYPTSLLTDKDDNVYVAGISRIDSFSITLVILKYDPVGSLLWQSDFQNWGGNGVLAEDENKNILLAGCSLQPNDNGYLDEFITTLHYSSQGVLDWVSIDTFGAANNILVNSKNEIYVSGPARDGVHYNTILIKYDSLGNRLWRKWYGTDTYYTEYSLASCLDSDENICMSAMIDENGIRSNLLLKYDSTGNLLYNNRIDTSDFFSLDQWLGSDQNNNLIFLSEPFKFSRFESTGSLVWTKLYQGPELLFAHPKDLKIDHLGNVYACGYTTINKHLKAVLIKYDNEGNFLWEFLNDGLIQEWTDKFNSLAVHGNSIYVVGTSLETMDDAPDFILIKIAPCEISGSPLINGPDTVCENQNGVQYSVQDSIGKIFSWYIGGGSISNGDSTNNIEINWNDGGAWPTEFNISHEGKGLILGYVVDSAGCILNPIQKWVVIENCLGLNSTTKNNFLVSPNPFSSTIHLENQSWNGKIFLFIRDIYGRMIRTKYFIGGSETWDLSELRPGIYFIEIATAYSSEQVRLIKE